MEFSVFKQRVTKDFILSKINQETIMQYYTGLDVNSKKLALSPFRCDKKVTCSIYKSKSGILYLHDFATNEHINCFEAVMKLYNCNYYEALETIAKDFGLIDSNINLTKKDIKMVPTLKESESSKIRVQIKDFTEDELKWWEQFGITLKLLKYYHVYSIQHVFLNGNLIATSDSKNPIYGYYFGKNKNKEEQWKIYFPLRTNYRFLNNISKKTLQGYKQLPKEGDLLVITKSMKDVIALKRFNIPAVAPNSETLFVSDKQLEEFKKRFKNILVVYDSDRPGKYNLAKIRKQYPELNYYFLPKYLDKDFTDSIKKVGIDKMITYIKEFLSNYEFRNK